MTNVTGPSSGDYCVVTSVPIKNVSGGVADFEHGGSDIAVSANFDFIPSGPYARLGRPRWSETTNGSGSRVQANFWISFN